MAQTASNFKLIFLTIFIAGAILGILIFAGLINVGGNSKTGTVEGSATMWGTVDPKAFQAFINEFNIQNPQTRVLYVQKDPATFDQAIIESIAAGSAPDLILLPNNLAWRFKDRLTHIPFTSIPAQTFQTTFVSGANTFLVNDGTLAIPWLVDPLVMYYNQDMQSRKGIAIPPKTWPEFTTNVPMLTKKESDLTVIEAGAGFGTYKNIKHAKDIIALLFLQSGNRFIDVTSQGEISVHFGATAKNTETTLASKALDFYLSFSNPVNPLYTWNDGFSSDREMFIQNSLAYYFGYASELPLIRASNPNLNFSLTTPPQFVKGTTRTTGTVYGIAIPKTAKNQALSYSVASTFAGKIWSEMLVSSGGSNFAFAPARRDVITQKPTNDPYKALIYDSALVYYPWVDPNPRLTDPIFRQLISTITSGVLPTYQALIQTGSQLQSIGASI